VINCGDLEEVANMKIVPNWISYHHVNSWIVDPFLSIVINLLKSKIDLDFTNFNSKSILNVEKFLWRKLFPSSNSSRPYFISKFSSSGRSYLGRKIWNDLN
jgi:hypothetical protein